jgi:acyl-CoA synthetase (AMP-forming)/AMP-acid ligase II
MFNSGGENVYPKEVENVLIAHPKVYDACVAPVPDPVKGAVPVAMVMLAEGETMSEAELKEWALARGPAYAHPRHIVFVDRMPLNSAAKVDRTVIGADLVRRFGPAIAARRAKEA